MIKGQVGEQKKQNEIRYYKMIFLINFEMEKNLY